MPANYVLLEKITVGAAGASSVTFSGIPQTGYTDLVVKCSVRSGRNATADTLNLTVNGGTTYSNRTVYGNGTSPVSFSGATAEIVWTTDAANTANTFSNAEFYIPNYTSSNAKSISADSATESNATTAYAALSAGLSSSTSAINSITLTSNTSNTIQQYSTFYLYGVAKLGTTPAISPYATGGDTIMTDGTYWYHTFVSSGTFTPQKSITCDYLVVAGGGSGGGRGGGGGGAGGLRSTVTNTGGLGTLETPLSLASNTAYTVTIGAGGSSSNGSDSVFSTITSTGGGRGASVRQGAGSSGGSGGGAGFDKGAVNGGGTRTASPVQGFDGSQGAATSVDASSGGGGGAGGVGTNGASSGVRLASGSTGAGGGNGGIGVQVAITGTSTYYAGGGGGGSNVNGANVGILPAGGLGGGGNGSTVDQGLGTSGTANTGGGGGGGDPEPDPHIPASTTGGSGIVIVRYAV